MVRKHFGLSLLLALSCLRQKDEANYQAARARSLSLFLCFRLFRVSFVCDPHAHALKIEPTRAQRLFSSRLHHYNLQCAVLVCTVAVHAWHAACFFWNGLQ